MFRRIGGLLRWLFDIYLPFARRGQRELRSPLARLLVSGFCLFGATWLGWLVWHTFHEHPLYQLPALLLLSLPLLGVIFLIYVVYLVLFAPGSRVRKGLIPTPALRFFGYGLIPLGFWMLGQGRLDGAIAVVTGLGALGLARQRSNWSFGDY